MKKYYLTTFGCQMNKNDSERIAGLLELIGLVRVEQVSEADLILINTCSVRQSAENRVYGLLKNWQLLRSKKPELIIAVTGCMPGRDKDGKIRNKIKGVDLFFGIEELIFLPKWLRELNPTLLTNQDNNLEITSDYLQIIPTRDNFFQSFITIQTGCNNHCTYCVVPQARGPEKNRPIKEIMSEAKKAVADGALEITLLGQVVNNYRAPDKENFLANNPFKDCDDFAALLWEVNQIEGLKRFFYTAPDPQYFSEHQVEALKLSKHINYLHLPVQSGDNQILKKMNRKYTCEQYLELIGKIKQARPKIALGTDLIVGFCSETDQQFANTVDLYKKCDFDISYPAMYSPRTGTAAARAFVNDVKHDIKKKRWQIIQNLMEEIAFIKNKFFLNKIVEVLVEDCQQSICSGRSNEMKLVQFLGDNNLIGQMVKVKITKTDTWLLRGQLIK